MHSTHRHSPARPLPSCICLDSSLAARLPLLSTTPVHASPVLHASVRSLFLKPYCANSLLSTLWCKSLKALRWGRQLALLWALDRHPRLLREGPKCFPVQGLPHRRHTGGERGDHLTSSLRCTVRLRSAGGPGGLKMFSPPTTLAWKVISHQRSPTEGC